MRRVCFWLALCVLAVINREARAQSAVDTCLNVASTRADVAALARLVRSELARHPSHRMSEPPACTQQLDVELIAVASELYLTAQLNGQVPHRVRVTENRTDRALSELLRVVLGSDPLVLRDERRGSWLSQALQGLRRRAHPLWGVELSQRWVFAGGTPLSMPGLSLHHRRELGTWQLGLRVDAAVWAAGRLDARHATLIVSLLPELAWFSSATSAHAFFVSLGVGVSHQRFEGPREGEPEARATALRTGPLLAPRLGVELFRTTDTRLSVFLEVALPVFSADDPHTHVVRSFTPSSSVGVGASF